MAGIRTDLHTLLADRQMSYDYFYVFLFVLRYAKNESQQCEYRYTGIPSLRPISQFHNNRPPWNFFYDMKSLGISFYLSFVTLHRSKLVM